MITNSKTLKFASMFSAFAMLAACGKSIDTAEWNEEILLHDGQLAVVWRKARAYSNGFPNAPRGRDIDFELKYGPMNLSWRGELSGTWIRYPISFEIFDGTPYLVLLTDDRHFCEGRSEKDYSAEFLRWSDGRWISIPQTEFQMDKALINLSADYWGHSTASDYKGLVTWTEKKLPGGYNQDHPDTVKSYLRQYKHFCKYVPKA